MNKRFIRRITQLNKSLLGLSWVGFANLGGQAPKPHCSIKKNKGIIYWSGVQSSGGTAHWPQLLRRVNSLSIADKYAWWWLIVLWVISVRLLRYFKKSCFVKRLMLGLLRCLMMLRKTFNLFLPPFNPLPWKSYQILARSNKLRLSFLVLFQSLFLPYSLTACASKRFASACVLNKRLNRLPPRPPTVMSTNHLLFFLLIIRQ